ncbi:hypothetical protein GCM10007853_25320 [Algimonas ampicilliniresistens]|uniref:Uncharacterized protein n=1 Tax=Algimonas ampicilliniresistens TaxID=1298735 RepID=A0ABQ5VB54_9PROT|nr:hypothetical protein GCM10007853_25320 [Algimonas ampicilliniresistens]
MCHHPKCLVTAHGAHGIGEEHRRIIRKESIEQGANSPPEPWPADKFRRAFADQLFDDMHAARLDRGRPGWQAPDYV